MKEQTKRNTEVESAREMVGALQRRREVAAAKLDDLLRDRKRIAFDAHGAGNVHAQNRLAELNSQIITTQEELRSLDDAIDEAGRRVKVAEANLANAAERKKARIVLGDAEIAEKLAKEADEAGRKFRESLIALEQAMDRIAHSNYRGVAPSRGMQLGLSRAVQSLLIGLKHVGVEVMTIPPGQRHSITQTVSTSIASARGAARQILDGAGAHDAAA